MSMIVETKVGAEKPPPKRTASLLLQELVGGPTVDVHLERSASLSSITKEESLIVRIVGKTRCVPFNHQMGNCGADVTVPGEAHHTAASAEAMCVLQG